MEKETSYTIFLEDFIMKDFCKGFLKTFIKGTAMSFGCTVATFGGLLVVSEIDSKIEKRKARKKALEELSSEEDEA